MDKNFLENKSLGFGSSDASLVIKFAKTENMSPQLRRRVSEIKGLIPRAVINSRYFDLGNRVEEDMFKYMHLLDPETVSNPTTHSPLKYKNFTVYNHIDMISPTQWVELKATKDDAKKTLTKYMPQLGWHKMIQIDNAIDLPLILKIYDTTDVYKNPDDYEFDKTKVQDFEVGENMLQSELNYIREGLIKLDQQWDEIPEYTEREVMEYNDEELESSKALSALKNELDELNFYKSIVEEKKRRLQENMEANNIMGIKIPGYNMILKAPTVTSRFDSTRFKTEHPELFEKYQKQSQVKGSLTIKARK